MPPKRRSAGQSLRWRLSGPVARQRPEKAEGLKVGMSEKFGAASARLNVDSIRQLDGFNRRIGRFWRPWRNLQMARLKIFELLTLALPQNCGNIETFAISSSWFVFSSGSSRPLSTEGPAGCRESVPAAAVTGAAAQASAAALAQCGPMVLDLRQSMFGWLAQFACACSKL
jgi:hypothetical protein